MQSEGLKCALRYRSLRPFKRSERVYISIGMQSATYNLKHDRSSQLHTILRSPGLLIKS